MKKAAAVILAVSSPSFAYYMGGDTHAAGYGGADACVPGYDKDCPGTATAAGAPPANQLAQVTAAPVVPTVAPVTVAPQPAWAANPGDHMHAIAKPGFTAPTAAPVFGAQPAKSGPDCTMTIPDNCVFPFVYKSLTYTACTGVDAVAGQNMWCSTSATYGGHWAECKDPCKGHWPVKKIVGSVAASSVAAVGLGLLIDSAVKGDIPNPFEHHGTVAPQQIIVIQKPVAPQPGVPAIAGIDLAVDDYEGPAHTDGTLSGPDHDPRAVHRRLLTVLV